MSDIFENLTKEEAVQVLSRVLDKESCEKVTIFLYAKEHNVAEDIESTINDIGMMLLTQYLLPFEVVSILLLAALIGAAMLSRKKTE